MSFARISGVVYACLGLLFGGLFSIVSMAGLALSNTSQSPFGRGGLPPALGFGLGIGAIIAFPIFYGILGFLIGLIGAWIYNLVSSWVGGIQMEVA